MLSIFNLCKVQGEELYKLHAHEMHPEKKEDLEKSLKIAAEPKAFIRGIHFLQNKLYAYYSVS